MGEDGTCVERYPSARAVSGGLAPVVFAAWMTGRERPLTVVGAGAPG